MINGEIMKKLFNDENLSKDERYLVFLLITKSLEEGTLITITLSEIMRNFNIKRKITVLNILNSLVIKGYIEIIRTTGKANSYRIIKDYLANEGLIISSNKNHTGNGSDTSRCKENGVCSSNKNDTGIRNVTSSGNGNDTGCGNKFDTSNENDTSTSYAKDTSKGNISVDKYNNKLNNNNINNKLYKQILDVWNKQNILNENNMNIKITDAINNALKSYTEFNITKAIENYSKVYKSSYYYNYKWSLVNFLNRPKGIPRFLDHGDIWLEYKSNHYSEYDEMLDLGIDIQNYID